MKRKRKRKRIVSYDNPRFRIHTADGGSANGEMKEGIIELDVNGDGSYLICYALPETDLSEYTIISLDEFQALQDTSAQTSKP